MSDLEKIKKLREETGLSMAEIKKALDAAGGDEIKAMEQLNQLGASMAAKKGEREVKEGLVHGYVHSNGKAGAMLEILCETDFVARNEDFKSLAHDIALHITAMKPETNEELLAQPFVKDPSVTIKDLINQAIAKLGENIQLGKFHTFEV